jgi:L-alanine-DL-glutamate epimerase-like enolase superfamily enzyme
MAYLQDLAPLGDDPFALEEVLRRLPEGSQAARASVDIALHDLWGNFIDQPLFRLFGLASKSLPQTSFTIGIDAPEEMARIAQESNYPIYKVKLDADDPEGVLAAIRKVSDARIRVDANASWQLEQAVEIIPRLACYDLEFVEQPLPPGDIHAYRSLRENLHSKGVTLPIFVDEDVKTSRDVAAFARDVDGVVVKLMKAGGLREAIRTIHTARAHGLKVMLSCMVESSVGVTAAAHIASQCDYVDLDSPLLIANDPFKGVKYDNANLSLPDDPGLGVLQVNL